VSAAGDALHALAARRERRGAIKRGTSAPAPAPFVVGATRSGTTLLRLMLDAHPQLAIPSETHFIPELVRAREKHGASSDRMIEMMIAHRRWGDFGLEPEELKARWDALPLLTGPEAVREFFKLYGSKQGSPPRWGDKTPGYIKHMREIQEFLPEARFVHLIRDGRDVALSVIKQAFGPETVEAAAEKWRSRILRGRAQAPYLGHYIEVKFEDLIVDTEATLRQICEFVELEFDPAMLSYYERAEERLAEKARALPRGKGREDQSAERRMESHKKTHEPPNPDLIAGWKERMPAEEQAAYEAIAGDLLIDLGYGAETLTSNGAAVHVPRSGLRMPRPLRRAATIAAHATGLREPVKVDRPPAPFPIGAARSGTDLLRAMLDAHPEMTMLTDTGFVPNLAEIIRSEPVTTRKIVKLIEAARPLSELGLSEDELLRRLDGLEEVKAAPVLRAFYDAAAELGGTRRWGDESPYYLKRMRRIQRALSEARFIHVVRDGRDTAAAKPGELDVGSAIAIAQRWAKKVGSIHQQAHLIDHLLEIRYEDLVGETEATLRRVCEFIELDFDAAMIAPAERTEIEAALGAPGGWREKLSDEQRQAFEDVAGEELATLGYPLER